MKMGELDQVFENFNKKNREYNKEEWIEFKKQEKQDVYALIDTTAEKIVSDGQYFIGNSPNARGNDVTRL